jgi:hypothetical protein
MIIMPNRKMDFGSGFYTTLSRTQAENWAEIVRLRRKSGNAYVTEFTYLPDPEMNMLIFDKADFEWLDFILLNRTDDFDHDYDIVIGPVADDSVYDALMRYQFGYSSKDETLRELNTAKLDGQILFHTDKSLKCLVYSRAWEVK